MISSLITRAAVAAVLVLPALPAAAAATYSLSLMPLGPGFDQSLNRVFNSSGDQAAGGVSRGTHDEAAYIDASTGEYVFLGTLGGRNSSARGISDNRNVTGESELPGNVITHAFLWTAGVMFDLGTLGGSSSTGNAVNDARQVVGYSFVTGNSAIHAFLWDASVMTDLGTLGGDQSIANDINNAGQIVGNSRYIMGVPDTRAFLWEDGVMYDLNTLLDASGAGWTLVFGLGINDDGRIWAQGYDPEGQLRSVVLDPIVATAVPVPAPGALALFGVGLALLPIGLGCRGGRRASRPVS